MNIGTLVSVAELAARIDDPRVIVVDCRFELSDPGAGAKAWRDGHIAGAVYADLDHDLADLRRTGMGRHPLPDANAFATWLTGIGWTPEHSVVVYDDASGALAAARLWWLLRLTGHRDVAVLDGGMRAWVGAGLALETVAPSRAATTPVELAFAAEQLVDYGQLQDGLASDRLLLADARGAARFRGEVEPIDPIAGHVPGARNRPFTDNLDASGLAKPSAQLRAEWLAVIDGYAPSQVVHMCGSGVSACHNLLAMEHAGLAGSRLFAPSWSGWISDPGRAVAAGD